METLSCVPAATLHNAWRLTQITVLKERLFDGDVLRDIIDNPFLAVFLVIWFQGNFCSAIAYAFMAHE